MAKHAISPATIPATFAELLRAVELTMVKGQLAVDQAKPDKYDRYLADVFLTLEDSAAVYLNNALLENGHAVRKEEWEFGDWGT